MSDQNDQEAAELAKKARGQAKGAAGQAKAAAKNTGRAARAAAEPVVDAVADEVQDTAEKLEGTAEDAVQTAKRINPRVFSRLTGDTGIGFLALSVSIWAGTIAFNQFRGVFRGSRAMTTRADRIIETTPNGPPSE